MIMRDRVEAATLPRFAQAWPRSTTLINANLTLPR